MRTLKLDAMMVLIALFLPGFASATDNLPSITSVPAPRDAGSASTDFGATVPAEQLESYRGGYTEIDNTALSKGTVQDNTAVNVSSGVNLIAGGSFTNASGLPIVIQNSGSNVLIQNSTIVNLQFQ